MRFWMIAVTAGFSATAAMGTAAAEMQKCARGADVRTVSVLIPGEVGRACDVKYARDDGANIRTPYHADNDAEFCAQKARALVASLEEAGFQCVVEAGPEPVASPPPLRAEADEAPPPSVAAAEPAPAPVAAAEPTPPSVAAVEPLVLPPQANARPAVPAPDAPAPGALAMDDFIDMSPNAGAGAPEPAAPEPAAPETVAPEPPAMLAQPEPVAPAALADAELDGAAPEPAEPALAIPPPAADRGPTALAPTTASAEMTKPGPSDVGRLVGAAPEETSPAVARDAEPVSPPAPVSAPAPVTAPEPAPAPGETAVAARPAADVIKSVLAAQVAAWNEGDLDGFMSGFWKSPDLRFVAGSNVTTGWTQIVKRVRDRYNGDTPMGRLNFDGLDVKIASDNVAIVVGKFNLTRPTGVTSGNFTFVMKRFDGLWRIVHDHSSTDMLGVG